jgi:hypothetical protein
MSNATKVSELEGQIQFIANVVLSNIYSVIGIIILALIWYLVKNYTFIGAKYALIGKRSLVNRIYPTWPNFPYARSTIVTVFLSTVIAGILAIYSSPIVSVTAFYASILFFNQTIRVQVPLLNIEFLGESSGSVASSELVSVEDSDDYTQEHRMIKAPINIINVGDKPADNVQILYSVHRLSGKLVKGWTRYNCPNDEKIEIKENGRSVSKEIPLDVVNEYTNQRYIVQMKVKPNVSQGQLTLRYIGITDPNEG